MKILIIFPHALGDMVLLTPALKAWCENNKPPSIVVQRRFNSSPLDNCPYIDKVYYRLSDPWQDFGHHNTQIGFPATQFEGNALAIKEKFDQVLFAHEEGKTINYANMLQVDIKNYKPEVFISHQDKMEAYKIIYDLVGNNYYGFVHTHSGDPNRSLPTDYGRIWIQTHSNLSDVIEIDNIPDLSINVGFEILNQASTVIVPNSVYWQAAGAMNKKVDLGYFPRGPEDLKRRQYEAHYDKKDSFYKEEFYKSVVFELEILGE